MNCIDLLLLLLLIVQATRMKCAVCIMMCVYIYSVL